MNLHDTLSEYFITQYLKGQAPEGFDHDYDLIESGILDSLAMLTLVTHLENHYHLEFSEHDLVPEHFRSVTALAEFVQKKQMEPI